MVFHSTELIDFLLRPESFTLPDHHDVVSLKIPKLHLARFLEWQVLKYYSALLTKVYWNYSTIIVRARVTPFHPTTAALNVNSKSKKQVYFGSKAMTSLYELFYHHSLTCCDPLLEALLSYLTTGFPTHLFDYIVYKSSDNNSVNSINSSVSGISSVDSI